MKWFRGGLAFKAHRLLYHSTLGLRVIKKKMKPAVVEGHGEALGLVDQVRLLEPGLGFRVSGFRF